MKISEKWNSQYSAKKLRLLYSITYLIIDPIEDTDLVGNKISVSPTFPYNPDSKTSPETAKRWAWTASYHLSKDGCRISSTTPVEKYTKTITRKNDPFSLKIIDIDARSEGGRAYIVIDDEGRRFDLREDQVLEAIAFNGIEAGGKIKGSFVWGVAASTVRLVLYGGELWTKMSNPDTTEKKKKNAAKIPGKDLIVGHMYKQECSYVYNGPCLYLGKVRYLEKSGTMSKWKYAYHVNQYDSLKNGQNIKGYITAQSASPFTKHLDNKPVSTDVIKSIREQLCSNQEFYNGYGQALYKFYLADVTNTDWTHVPNDDDSLDSNNFVSSIEWKDK